MKPPGKTTLSRMQRTAMLEAERIEIGEDGRVTLGMIKEPREEIVERRDDFAGIVRMIDAINSDKSLLDRLKERMAAMAKSLVAPAPANAEDDLEVEVVD
ncbi:MAG: hypothetical protein J0H40_17830 [Rhizobiales bacterium]|nr:hypothetical protein [Hyphomicrobiales bacterium]